MESNSGKAPNSGVLSSKARTRRWSRPSTSTSTARNVASTSSSSFQAATMSLPVAPRALTASPTSGKPGFPGAEQALESSRVERAQLPERAGSVHPFGLVRLVAIAIVDAADAVLVEHVAEHRRGEDRARRQRLRGLGISQLVNGRLFIFDQPELGGDRRAVLPRDAEAQRAGGALLLGERAQESERAFVRLPAGAVDRFIFRPGGGIEAVVNHDVQFGGPGAPLDGIAQLAGPLGPISVEIEPGGVGAPVEGEWRDQGDPAGVAEGLLERGGVLQRGQVDFGQAAIAERRGDGRQQILVGTADGAEAQRVEIGEGVAERMAEVEKQPGAAPAFASPQDEQLARRRAVSGEQAEPVEPVEQARLGGPVERAAGVVRHRVEILEKLDFRHFPSASGCGTSSGPSGNPSASPRPDPPTARSPDLARRSRSAGAD